jgi:hypothetical protein
MTPAERKRAQEICDKATPGPWVFTDVALAGPSQFSVYAEKEGTSRWPEIFRNIEIDMNGLNNLAFITEARVLLPKALLHIEALQGTIENCKAGFANSFPPVMTLEEIKRAKELSAAMTKGEWTCEDDSQIGPGVVTLYAGRGPMAHGLNLFGRFVANDNGENNLTFITEAQALLPKALDHIENLSNTVQRMTRPGLALRPQSYKPPAPPAPKPPGM